MKVGEYSIKRHYSFAQIVIDLVSAFIIYLIVRNIFWLRDMVFTPSRSPLYLRYSGEVPFEKWGFIVIFPVIAIIILGISIFLVFKNKKEPKKFSITDKNSQSYSNIINDTIYMLRLVLLIAVFEISGIYSDFVMKGITDIFNKTLFFLLCFVGLIIYFMFTRLNKISDKKDSYIGNKKL